MRRIETMMMALYLLFAMTPSARAEINQEYYFFPIGTWLIPPAYNLSTETVNANSFNAPPSSCYNLFDDFKLDWVRARLVFVDSQIEYWTDNGDGDEGGPDGIPDEFQCGLKYLNSFASTGVRVQMTVRSLTHRLSAFHMIRDYTEEEAELENPPKMRYPIGVLEGEGVSLFPLRYGPDGAFQYFHPFKNNGVIYPKYYEDEYPEYDTDDHNVYANDQDNYEAFEYHTVTLYDGPGGHGLENPYSYFTDSAPDNLYYIAAEHEIRDHNFSYTREAYEVYDEQMIYYGGLNDNLYPPRFLSMASDGTGAEMYIPYWVKRQKGDLDAAPVRDDFANWPDAINNHFRWYLSWIEEDVLFGRATYPWRWNMPVNSDTIYIGRPKADITKWHLDESGDWESVSFPGVKEKGFYQVYYNNNRLREASRIYQIPAWCCPQIAQEHANAALRYPTPREVRSQVNMSLTYGLKGMVYYRIYTTKPDNISQGPPYVRGLTYYDIDGTSYGPLHGQLRTDSYDSLFEVGGIEYTCGDDVGDDYPGLPYPDLIDEVIAVNTKLDKVRHSIYTLDNHASVWLGEEEDQLPAHFIKAYSHNRESEVPDGDYNYAPEHPYADHGDFIVGWDDEEEEWIYYNSIDVGAFTDYDGVRYFAVSDRFNNWVPNDYSGGTYGNPTGKDGVGLYAPGNKMRGIYNDYYDGGIITLFDEVIDRGSFSEYGYASYQFELGNGDGRFFEVMPNLTDNWSFEEGEDQYGNPTNWYLWPIPTGTGTDDTVKRTGDYSFKIVSEPLGDVVAWSNDDTGQIIANGGTDLFAGSVYRLGGYIKADSVYDGSAYIRLSLYVQSNPEPVQVIETPVIPSDTSWAPGGWVWTETIIKPSDFITSKYDTAKLAVVVESSSLGGSVWFDEACFEDVNRIYNGGFEFRKHGYEPDPLMWEALSDGGGGDDFEISSAEVKYDNYSCKITPDSSDKTWVENEEWIYVNAFSEYTMNFSVKPDISGFSLTNLKPYVRFFDSKDDEMYYTGTSPLYGDNYTGTSVWVNGSIRVTPDDFETVHNALPPDPERKPVFEYPAYVKVGFEVSTGDSGYFYVDGVTFRETNLIKNPSFETDRKGDGYTVAGTTVAEKTPDKWVRDDDQPQSIPPGPIEQGFMDLYKMDNYRSWRVDADDTYHPMLYSDTISFPTGQLGFYDFAGWQRTHGITGMGNGAEYKIKVYAADGTLINNYSTGIHQDNMNFVERGITGISPGAFAVIETYATGDGGVVDFDCVWLGKPMP